MTPIELISTVIAVATILYCIFTGWLTWETRCLRKAQTDPVVILSIERSPDSPVMLVFAVENTGGGIAYDLRFELPRELQVDQFADGGGFRAIPDGPLIDGIPVLAPRKKVTQNWGHERGLFDRFGSNRYEVTIYYCRKPSHKPMKFSSWVAIGAIDPRRIDENPKRAIERSRSRSKDG